MFPVTDQDILSARGPKNALDVFRPWAFHIEPERTAAGEIEEVATLFLTNRECPFRCLMCDLWKNTTDEKVPTGAIPRQIDYALARLPEAAHIKLYNSGNFFDVRAIPREDYPAIVERVRGFKTVIVENHPRLTGGECLRFRDALGTNLEVAIGLETVHPEVLPRLNKQMTAADFARAAEFVCDNEIAVRAFILLKPPFLSEPEGLHWAIRSLEFAFAHGAGCCTVIPTRAGNGIMEQLQQQGDFAPPALSSLEEALEEGLKLRRGRVFVDLWDVEKLFDCPDCGPRRAERLRRMNLSQQILPPVDCHCREQP